MEENYAILTTNKSKLKKFLEVNQQFFSKQHALFWDYFVFTVVFVVYEYIIYIGDKLQPAASNTYQVLYIEIFTFFRGL